MLTFARRLLREGATDASMLLEAERALGTAVSALSMVEPHEAWLEDPMPAGPPPTRAYLGDDAMEGKARGEGAIHFVGSTTLPRRAQTFLVSCPCLQTTTMRRWRQRRC